MDNGYEQAATGVDGGLLVTGASSGIGVIRRELDHGRGDVARRSGSGGRLTTARLRPGGVCDGGSGR